MEAMFSLAPTDALTGALEDAVKVSLGLSRRWCVVCIFCCVVCSIIIAAALICMQNDLLVKE